MFYIPSHKSYRVKTIILNNKEKFIPQSSFLWMWFDESEENNPCHTLICFDEYAEAESYLMEKYNIDKVLKD